MSINNVVLKGRWTKDLELNTKGATLVAKGTLAVDRRVGKDREKATDFVPVTLFGKLAENTANYCGSKGDKISVIGHIQTGKYVKDNITHYTFEVIADVTDFDNERKSNSTPPENNDDEHMTPVDDGELPF